MLCYISLIFCYISCDRPVWLSVSFPEPLIHLHLNDHAVYKCRNKYRLPISHRKEGYHNVAYTDQYADPPYGVAAMYASRVACCPLVSHVEYQVGPMRRALH